MNLRLSIFVLAVLPLAAASSSGNDAIDAARREAAASPTTAQNSAARLSMLYSWFRLLLHQGIDLREFEPARMKLVDLKSLPAIDEAYRALEQIQARPKRVPEKSGASGPAGGPATDWPVFHRDAAQTGYTDDPGPSQGRLAWRFPIGRGWYASPSIENGRVYVASPGMGTVAWALDERSGSVLWAARQPQGALYQTPRAASNVVVLPDHVVVRETGSQGEPGNARHLVYIDKANGKIAKEAAASHVDYRRSYAPVTGSSKYLAIATGYQWIQGMPALVWMLDTVALKDAKSGATLWSIRTGDIFGDPAIDGDRVYAAAADGVLYALNAEGQKRIAWQYRFPGALHGTPAVSADSVYIGSNDGTFLALDKASGKERWRFRVPKADERAFVFFSTATIAGGRVYAGAADRRVYCFDERTGQLLWSRPTTDWVRSRPAVAGDRIFVASMDGGVAAFGRDGETLWQARVGEHQVLADLVAGPAGLLVSTSDLYLHSLDLSTGKPRWRHSLLEAAYIDGKRYLADTVSGGADYQSSPTAVGNRVFIGAPNHFVYAVDKTSGKERWRFETSGQVSGTPTHAGGVVYFGQQGGDKNFYAVDAATGQLRWKRALGWAWAGASYSDGNLFIGTVEGDVHCVRARDGELLWTHATNGGVYPAPAIDDNNVYTGSWDGHAIALDKKTGRLRWAFHLGGHPDSAAIVLSKGMVLVQALGRNLHALDAKTGAERWRYAVPPEWKMNATPAVHDGKAIASIYIDNNRIPYGATILALDDATGKVLWQHRGGGSLTGASIARDRVYFGSTNDVFLSSVDLQTGQLIWRYRTGGLVYESCPAISGGRMFVLVDDGYLYAID